jgi:uncharacterized protein YndB with AHSA1/START domain
MDRENNPAHESQKSESMRQGWSGTLDQLAQYLAKV